MTAKLPSHCFPADGVKLPLPTAAAQAELRCACNVYRLLSFVPPEYFTRPVRGELIKRAMAGDLQICAMLAGANEQRSEVAKRFPAEDSGNWSQRLMFVRAFLQRMGQFLSTTNHTVGLTFSLPIILMQDMIQISLAFVNHLLSSPCTSSPPKALTNVTLDLIQLHVLCVSPF